MYVQWSRVAPLFRPRGGLVEKKMFFITNPVKFSVDSTSGVNISVQLHILDCPDCNHTYDSEEHSNLMVQQCAAAELRRLPVVGC